MSLGRTATIRHLEQVRPALCKERQKIHAKIFHLNRRHVWAMGPHRREYHTLKIERVVLSLEIRATRQKANARIEQRRRFVEEARQTLVCATRNLPPDHPSLIQRRGQLIHLLAALAEDIRDLANLRQQQGLRVVQFRARTRDLVRRSGTLSKRHGVEREAVDSELSRLCGRLATVDESLKRLREEEKEEREMVLLPAPRRVARPKGVWNTRSNLYN